MSKNAEGWIRHRGGKCPVEAGVKVDYRMRNGSIRSGGRESETLEWGHYSDEYDIMAYRLHKPAEQVEACGKPDPRDSAKRDSDYVCWMRDRITEIDSTTQALTTERANLVQKLASEGFALIGPVKADNASVASAVMKAGGEFYSKPVEDMSDWRNWKVGDFIVRVSDKKVSGMPLNEVMKINRIDASDPDQPVRVGYGLWPYLCDVEWHSRALA